MIPSRLLAALRFRLRALLFPERVAREIDEELERHLRDLERDLVAEGMDPDRARRVARRELGDVAEIRERCRALSHLPEAGRSRKGIGDMLTQDLKYAFRALSRRPTFALVAAATLALGIATTTGIYSLVDGIVFSPLPYPDSRELVAPTAVIDGLPVSVSHPEFLLWRAEPDLFEATAAYTGTSRDLSSGEGDPERLEALAVSADYFRVFRAEPVAGRFVREDDYAQESFRVVVLGEGFWRRRFGGEPGIVGSDIRLSGRSYRVIGIVDEETVAPASPDIWLPMWFGDPPPDWLDDWDNYFLQVVARLAPGVGVATADTRIRAIADRLRTDMPKLRSQAGGAVISLRERIVGPELRTGLFVLLGAVSLVLLIACVNVANLLLARGAERDREVSVRRALGASRGDLARQVLMESLLVAALGGFLGIVGAEALTRAIVSQLPASIPRLADVGTDLRVLLFATGASVSTAFLFGILPALQLGRGDLTDSLHESSRGATGGRRVRFTRSALVVAEVAFSLVLLVGAGLMLGSLGTLLERDAGLDLEHTLAAQVRLPSARYETDAEVERFYLEVTESLRALPGVEAAAAAMTAPLVGGGLYRVHVEEGAAEPPEGPDFAAQWNVVTPGFFRAVGIPVRAGRGLEPTDTEETEPVIIVSESFARKMFPGEDPLGRRIRSWRDENLLRRIVGVVGDVRMGGMAEEVQDLVYVSASQSGISPAALLVRTEGDPFALAAAVRDVVWEQDPELPVANLASLRELAERSVDRFAVVGNLLSVFALIALGLAATGLYGVMSWAVAQRGREYGIRLALGARGADVVRTVIAGALRLVGVGMGVGLVLALGLTRVLEGSLSGVVGLDPVAFVAVSATILLVSVAASLVPALRATRVDPVDSLRGE